MMQVLVQAAGQVALTAALLAQGSAQVGEAQLLERANASYFAMQSAEAVRLYQEYLSRYPDRADVRVFLGASLFNLGKADDALRQAERALVLDRRYGRAHVLAGRVHAGRNTWPLAQQCFAEALRLDPRDREAWYFSGRAYYEENLFEKAVAALLRARELGGEQARVYENLGLAYEALQKLPEAEAAHRRAVALAGGQYRPSFSYGAFLRRQGRPDEGLVQLHKALELNPRSAETQFEMAKAFLECGQADAAVQSLQAAIALSDECRFHHLLAKAYARAGQRGDAAVQLKRVEACWEDPAASKPEVRQ